MFIYFQRANSTALKNLSNMTNVQTTVISKVKGTKMENKKRLTRIRRLTANLKRRHDLPTPESPISKSLKR